MNIENYGNGKNITLQTLDAILCHNGEIVEGIYKPCKKSKQEFLKEYESTYKDKDACKKLSPMTLEGCVVRISDLIAYLGRDIDDAIRMNLLKWEDVPENITKVLGSNNSEIVNTIINDIIKNSEGKNYIKLIIFLPVFYKICTKTTLHPANLTSYTRRKRQLPCPLMSLMVLQLYTLC